jgi:hypothetical protein
MNITSLLSDSALPGRGAVPRLRRASAGYNALGHYQPVVRVDAGTPEQLSLVELGADFVAGQSLDNACKKVFIGGEPVIACIAASSIEGWALVPADSVHAKVPAGIGAINWIHPCLANELHPMQPIARKRGLALLAGRVEILAGDRA